MDWIHIGKSRNSALDNDFEILDDKNVFVIPTTLFKWILLLLLLIGLEQMFHNFVTFI